MWYDLETIARVDPALATRRWEELRQAARDELQCGHRAARAMNADNFGPWDRAHFLAIRDELSEGWQPQNGIERTLLDSMAQAYAAVLFWQERLTAYSVLEPRSGNASVKDAGRWSPPRVLATDAIDQAAGMVDRFNKLFLRTLRALRDLRRDTPMIVVNHANQVNVAGQQQVNMAGQAGSI